ncbi:unnamed protein product [Nyctereutes procyonoides]|uniref:(raccoon dog) hypothetical protein n=1 Tax=Nyctereutes procyonoides TaxID=34880 RepID=A0A811YJV5_NYCPR|nr:unnamed protein product [Nyctereutes procyonoides]
MSQEKLAGRTIRASLEFRLYGLDFSRRPPTQGGGWAVTDTSPPTGSQRKRCARVSPESVRAEPCPGRAEGESWLPGLAWAGEDSAGSGRGGPGGERVPRSSAPGALPPSPGREAGARRAAAARTCWRKLERPGAAEREARARGRTGPRGGDGAGIYPPARRREVRALRPRGRPGFGNLGTRPRTDFGGGTARGWAVPTPGVRGRGVLSGIRDRGGAGAAPGLRGRRRPGPAPSPRAGRTAARVAARHTHSASPLQPAPPSTHLSPAPAAAAGETGSGVPGPPSTPRPRPLSPSSEGQSVPACPPRLWQLVPSSGVRPASCACRPLPDPSGCAPLRRPAPSALPAAVGAAAAARWVQPAAAASAVTEPRARRRAPAVNPRPLPAAPGRGQHTPPSELPYRPQPPSKNNTLANKENNYLL